MMRQSAYSNLVAESRFDTLDSPRDRAFASTLFYGVLERQITDSILSPEEMADTASITLQDLRRKIRQTEDSIRTAFSVAERMDFAMGAEKRNAAQIATAKITVTA